MKRHFYILIAGALLLVVQACNNTKDVETKLHKADVYMDEHPELALEVLESIDTYALTTRETQAKYALLYSMALDKNYIDVTNDSIIAPAIAYYKNHGSSDDKLKVNYYWGRIAMNAGEYENAISRFIIAEQYADKTSDKIAVGRLYKAQTIVYQYCYDTDAMIDAAGRTASVYMELGDTTRYITSIFDQIAGFLNESDTTSVRQSLEHIKGYWPSMTELQKSQYYANQIILNGYTSPMSLPNLLDRYEKESDDHLVQWLAVAKAYYTCEDYYKAKEALDKYDYYGGSQNDTYSWISGLIYEALGDSLQAMHSYKAYIEQTDDKLGYLLEADIRFIKERYETQIKIARSNYILIVLALCAVILLLSSLLVVTRIKRIKRDRNIAEEKLKLELRAIEAEQIAEKIRHEEEMKNTKAEIDKYVIMYNAALSEIDNLNDALKNNTLDRTIKNLIAERLSLLNKFIASNMTPNFSVDAAEELKSLMRDKNYFIESTRISFLIEHPKFITYLKKKGLSDGEIGYCCLYAMGLKGKDISAYMGNGHYKLSSAIRKKFGLSEHDTNLDIFLREILAETIN